MVYLILAAGMVGILDAGFLVYEHYTGGTLPCTVFKGCDIVTTSRYSAILGVPISVPGLLYYVFIFGVALAILDGKNLSRLKFLFFPAAAAFVFSLYLVGIQAFALKSFCAYCMLSALNSTLIFIFASFLRRAKPPQQAR